MATLELNGVRKSFGDVEVIKGVDLHVADRDFVVFVGPSGCGKSTLLRMIAGLEEISSGTIELDGEEINDVPPAKRGLAMVFQSYALYPHMSVADNMGFSLRLAGVPKPERRKAVEKAARILQLEDYLDRRPRALSGGQRQRVAIGRSIVRDPKIFLFDEPLSNLDAALRVQMRTELARLHDELKATMIYVTHDQIEAMTLATKIVVLRAGRIEQIGSPLELYHHPANEFVAGFIGSPKMNFLQVELVRGSDEGAVIRLPGDAEVTVPVDASADPPGTVLTLGVRPEHLMIDDDGILSGEVVVTERLGGVTFAHVRDGQGHEMIVQAAGNSRVRLHDRLHISFDVESCHLFRSEGEALRHVTRNPLADLSAH